MDLDLDFDFVPFADIPSGLDGGGNANKVGKFQPRVKVNAESNRKLPVSCGASIGRGEGSISDAFNAENPEEEFVHPSLSSTGGPTLAPKNTSHEHVSQETLNNGETGLSDYDQDFLTNAAESEREEQALPNDIPQTTTLNGEWDLPGLEYFGDDQHTAPTEHDFGGYTLEYSIDEELSQPGNASGAKQSTQEDLDLPMLPTKQIIRSRKRNIPTPSENNATKVHSSNGEPSQETVNEEFENEFGEVDTSCGKKAQNGKLKATQKRKNASAGPEASTKEPLKKKFSHSTRKAKLSNTLLETPGHEINPKKLPMKDLIYLGQQREKSSKKDATTEKGSTPKQSLDNSYWEDADPDDPFATMQDLNPEEDTITHFKLNYHSFQKRRPRGKWSKQNTELFFEALGQFGTDFTLIEPVFPRLDDNPDIRLKMVKAKYKIEERKQPMRVHNALTNRSKSHKLFDLLIEKLPQAEEGQNSDEGMESFGVAAEAEDDVETDENAENMKDAEVDSPAKSVHETEDEMESDFGGYEPY